MKITIENPPPKCKLSELEYGDVFLNKGVPYIKVETHDTAPTVPMVTEVYAVRLCTGSLYLIDPDHVVEPAPRSDITIRRDGID